MNNYKKILANNVALLKDISLCNQYKHNIKNYEPLPKNIKYSNIIRMA